jgi:hypothetical protein
MILLTALMIAAEAPKLPAWMAGCWEYRSGDQWSEECWTIPRAGMMMGSGRNGAGDVLINWETMQITVEETDDPAIAPMAFWGSPEGKVRTMFSWVPGKEPGVTFVNALHDYPQRIRYWREGEELLAEISLADGSKPVRWRYRPLGN